MFKYAEKIFTPNFLLINVWIIMTIISGDDTSFFILPLALFNLAMVFRAIFSVWDDQYEERKRFWTTLRGWN